MRIKRLIEGNPAPYSQTSTAEVESRNIFLSLLNTQFVKGEIRVMDKYPNSDGILEITDQEQYPIGKIDIQLKTLAPANYSQPKYQCEKTFLAFCEISALPVIIVVVDRQNKKAYWRHIDQATLEDISKRMTGESCMLSIPKENCIDGKQEGYISEWTKKVKEVSEKLWMFDSMVLRQKELEEKLRALNSKLQTPVNLPSYALREILNFLDEYNFILDKEFASVKQILFPNYWKIGMGIIKYEFGSASFFLYPLQFDKSQQLIKKVQAGYDYLGKEMMEGNVLLWTSLESTEEIVQYPLPYAYSLLESSILRVAGKYNFPLTDLFLANEYIISFIDHYQQYLNLEKEIGTYALKDLKYMLYSVIPMLVATNYSFADWVVEHNHSIDSYDNYRSGKGHRKEITEAVKKIKQGFQPKVSVTVTSEQYNIDLIHYYIGLLEKNGFNVVTRQYLLGQRNEQMHGVDLWKTWNKDVLWSNIKLFFANFYQLYEDYITTHFPHIYESFKVVKNKEITIVHILHFDEFHTIPPHMEVYHLRPEIPEKGAVLCYLSEDPLNPIDRKKYFIDRQFDCLIEGKRYQMILMHVQPLDFMFAKSPSYALINDKLGDKLRKFFREKKSREKKKSK